jgi:recombination protein RecR
MKLPQALTDLIDQFEALPGIGKKSAQRLALYLLNVPQDRLLRFSQALKDLKTRIKKCENCFNLAEENICPLCQDASRNKNVICVVEDPLDILVVEGTRKFNGLYHVLYGRIDPLNNLGPDDILLPQLFARLSKAPQEIEEIILATNPNMEGETTAMYLKKRLEEFQSEKGSKFRITRLAYGLPMGASIEYADYGTLGRALDNRNEF